MQRILIIGSGGAGKTTLARTLGGILDISVIHLDALFWKPGWIESTSAEWTEALRSVMGSARWIMDGNYGRTLAERLERCDTVIFLDIPRILCLWRVIKRWIRYHGRSRPDMAAGCSEKIDLEFVQWIWSFPRRSRPAIMALLDEHRPTRNVLHLGSVKEVRRFLEELRAPLA